MTAPSALESESETVRRHASAFVRTWPEPPRDPDAYRPAPVPPKTALAVGVDDLGGNRSKRVQAVKAAQEAGWRWTAHAATSPTNAGATSVVIRFALACFGADVDGAPVTKRCVAFWRAKEGKALAWVAGYAWDERPDGARSEYVRVSGAELVPHLRRAGRPPDELDEAAQKSARSAYW